MKNDDDEKTKLQYEEITMEIGLAIQVLHEHGFSDVSISTVLHIDCDSLHRYMDEIDMYRNKRKPITDKRSYIIDKIKKFGGSATVRMIQRSNCRLWPRAAIVLRDFETLANEGTGTYNPTNKTFTLKGEKNEQL